MFDSIRGGRAYGPYLRKDGRKHIVINYPLTDGTFAKESHKETVSYPKWLVEQNTGRVLDPNLETVDHVDRDFTNDALTNLQVLPRPKHAALDAKRRTPTQVTCVWCQSEFFFVANRGKINGLKAGPFCSRKCSGAYGAAVRNNRTTKFKPMLVPVKNYYKLTK